MKADMHVHTTFSVDGKSTMEEQCIKAIQKGITHICFTEHVDFNSFEYARWQFDAKAYFKEVERLRKVYPELKILSGIEFSEPHLFLKEFNDMSTLPFDQIIASIHHCKNQLFPAPKNLPMEQASKEYYELMLKTVEFGKFQTLAHIDFPKRFFDEWLYNTKTLDEIFDIMIDKKMALEINTSMSKGLDYEPMPKYSLIEQYINRGGKRIVFGSDAHHADDLGKNFEIVDNKIPSTLEKGYFAEKRFIKFEDETLSKHQNEDIEELER